MPNKFKGKWPQLQVDILLAGFRQFLDHHKASVEDIKFSYSSTPPLRVMYDIQRQVVYDLQHDDDHPAYKSGQWERDGVIEDKPARIRIVDYDPRFALYPKGCDDTHRETVLKWIGQELGLLA